MSGSILNLQVWSEKRNVCTGQQSSLKTAENTRNTRRASDSQAGSAQTYDPHGTQRKDVRLCSNLLGSNSHRSATDPDFVGLSANIFPFCGNPCYTMEALTSGGGQRKVWIPSEVIDEMWRWIPTTGARAIYLLSWFYEPASILELSGKSLMDRGVVSKTCDMLESRGWMKMVRFQGKLRPTALVPTQCQEVMATRLQEGFEMAFDRGDFLAGKRLQWCLKTDDYRLMPARPVSRGCLLPRDFNAPATMKEWPGSTDSRATTLTKMDRISRPFQVSADVYRESSSETFAEGAGNPVGHMKRLRET